MVRLATQAKNRLHAVLHRYHIVPPPGVTLFAAQDPAWWLSLDLPPLQLALIQSDLDTLAFARQQISALEETLKSLAADDEQVPFLIQIPGVGFVTAVTLLAAIGDISRFPDAKHLVGYAGLGARVHASGLSRRTGRITKAGRRDIRSAMVEAAQSAVRVDPHWRQELQRLEPRLGRNKAIVAIARKLLTTVWHVLSKRCADRFAHPPLVARKLLAFADTIGRHGRPEGWSRAQFVRHHLDQLRLGVDLSAIRRGKRSIQLPPSSLAVT
jgi:transposase